MREGLNENIEIIENMIRTKKRNVKQKPSTTLCSINSHPNLTNRFSKPILKKKKKLS